MSAVVLFVGFLSVLIYFLAKSLRNSKWSEIWSTIRTVVPMLLAVVGAVMATIAIVVMF